MHYFDSETGQMKEIDTHAVKKSWLEIWVNRPKVTHSASEIEYLNWGKFVVGIVLIVLSLIWAVALYNTTATKWETQLEIERARNGYCQVSVLGVGGAVWQKCK